jgi:hypothetical protein
MNETQKSVNSPVAAIADRPYSAEITEQEDGPLMPQQVAPGLLSWASDIEPGTIEQTARAARLRFVTSHVALMADGHVGMGAMVGSVPHSGSRGIGNQLATKHITRPRS